MGSAIRRGETEGMEMNTTNYDVNNSEHFEKFLRSTGRVWNHLNPAQRKQAGRDFRAVCATQTK